MTTVTSTSAKLAIETARRLLDPGDVLAAVPESAAASLGGGLAGTALLHARLSVTDAVFATAATRHWAIAAAHAKRHRVGRGIFSNTGGLAASLITGADYLPDPSRQQHAVARAARWLSDHAIDVSRTHREQQRRTGDLTTPWAVYDVVSGLSGIGRVLLTAVTAGHSQAELGLLAALEALTTMVRRRLKSRPGWWLPADRHPPGISVHPSGAATTGVAHGIAGPLALLSVAHAAGWTVTGQRAAINHAAQWLLRWREHPTCSWPPHVTGDELDSDTAVAAPGRRDAWCYGTPGIGRALTLAGHALGDPSLAQAGEAAIASLLARPAQQWDVEGPTLCHGMAGVLQSAAVAAATGNRTAAAVTAAFDPKQKFAFQHVHNGVASDMPGFLTGAAGVALALADRATLPCPDVPTRWDSILLLS